VVSGTGHKEAQRARWRDAAAVSLRELCEEWKFQALQEYLVTLVAEGDDASDHVGRIGQPVGARGRTRRVAFEFHVTSHALLGKFIDVPGEEEPNRKEHVILQPIGPGNAVAMLPMLTFTRQGPRHTPDEMKLVVKAGFGAIVANNDAAPTPRFEPDVLNAQMHFMPMAQFVACWISQSATRRRVSCSSSCTERCLERWCEGQVEWDEDEDEDA
jgi:hypothetical protein